MEQSKIVVTDRIFETIAQYREGAINREKAMELLAPHHYMLLAELLEHGTVTALIDGEWKVAGVGVPSLKPDSAENKVVGTDSRDS